MSLPGESAGRLLIGSRSNERIGARCLLAAALAIGPCGPALAHSGARAFILLLPTQLYIVGGAAVVALSFVVMALIPVAGLRALERARWRLGAVPEVGIVGPTWGPSRAPISALSARPRICGRWC